MATFETVEQMLLAAMKPVDNMPDKERASLKGSEEFTGTKDFDEAVSLTRKGWSEGLSVIRQMQADIEHALEGQIPQPEARYRLYGQRIHMGRYLSGRPDCFLKMEDSALLRDSYAPKVIRIVFNVSSSGTIGKETLLRRGAAGIVLIDTLEKHGIRCQVDLAYVTTNSIVKPERAELLEYVVTAKQPGEPLEINRLAFLMGHPASNRRLMFSIMEHEPDDVRQRFGIGRSVGGYGFPGQATDQGDLYLDRIISNTDWSEALTMMWLKKTLKDQGIALSEKEVVNDGTTEVSH